MGLPTRNARSRPALFESLALWDYEASDPRESPDGGHDHLGGFARAVLNVRWATASVSVLLAGGDLAAGNITIIAAVAVVLAYTLYRTFVPLRYNGSPSHQAMLLAEGALFWSLVALTGFWSSPLVIASSSVLVVSGFAGGFKMALRIGAATAAGLTIVGWTTAEWTSTEMTEAIQGSTLLLLTGIIAGYGKRISGEARRNHSMALGRLSQLTDANTLLFNLHRLAQRLPKSLDRNEVLDASFTELRGLLEFDRALLLLIEETDHTWIVARQQGLGIEGVVDPSTLPSEARSCLSTWRTAIDNRLGPTNPGLHPESVSGLFAPLVARDRLIGVVLLESRAENRYTGRDRQTLNGLIQPMALAIDNARWFSRLRQATVDEERSRIARDLHDRVGQSLASLGFEIDRLLRYHQDGTDLGPDLAQLQRSVRAMTSEVRDALYDLRSDVAEKKDFDQTIGEFARRVAERSGLDIRLESEASTRLPLLQEREMWRIAQEALINVERHAEASTVTVRWRCDLRQAALEVADDGRGMTEKNAGRADSYGIVGMRERANSIGASLEIESEPGEGTTVRCYLNQT
ncbi:MAG: histidine kinase [Actinomycetota bacterium]